MRIPLADIPLERGRVASLIAEKGFDIPDNLSVDGAGDAVLELQVHLWDGVLGEDGSVRDITCKKYSVSHCSPCRISFPKPFVPPIPEYLFKI